MIDVTVSGDLVVGRRSSLSIVFTNTRTGPNSNIVFQLGLPTGMALAGGSDRVEIPMIPAGRPHVHEVTVEASRSGRLELTSPGFTYRDEYDAPVRVTDFRAAVTVIGQPDLAGPEVEPAARPPLRTILYLAASPQDVPQLRSDQEMRKVKDELRGSKGRERYRIELCPAVRFDDITRALIDHEPQVVHFSGHGGKDGYLRLEDDRGDSDPITPEGLASLFGQHKATIRCVILSACYSLPLAEAIAAQIEHVIGMHDKVSDRAAIQFSVGFYQALFAGWSVPEAFTHGRSHIQARVETEREHLTPLLFPPGR